MFYFNTIADKRKASVAKQEGRHNSVDDTKTVSGERCASDQKSRRFTTAMMEPSKFNRLEPLSSASPRPEKVRGREKSVIEDVVTPEDIEAGFNPALLTHLVNIGDVKTVKSLGLRPELEIDVSIVYFCYRSKYAAHCRMSMLFTKLRRLLCNYLLFFITGYFFGEVILFFLMRDEPERPAN